MNVQYKPSVVMDQLNQLGWVKSFNHSIKGQYYFSPRGTVVFNNMAEFLKNWVKQNLNSLEIRTPTIYDWEQESIQAESAQFAERVFQCPVDNKIGVLNPGGDYGVMSFLSEARLHESHFPIALFELTTSFRKGQNRELAGLLKARSFTLLDHHTFAAHLDQAWESYFAIILSQAKLGHFFEFNWTLQLQIESRFLKAHAEKIQELEQLLNTQITIMELKEKKNYWEAQHVFIDTDDQISFADGQFDLLNSKNYKIEYFSKDGKQKHYPVICHGSFDSVERWIFKLTRRAIASNGYDFPLWLAPTHIRFIPHNEVSFSEAETLKQKLNIANGVRSDIDFRKKTIEQRIQNAKSEWLPYTITFPKDFTTFNESKVGIYTLDGLCRMEYLEAFLQEMSQSLSPLAVYSDDLQSVLNRPAIR